MNLTRITYSGKKTLRDKISNNTWAEGETKLVTAVQANKLLRFAEFTTADGEPTDKEQAEAMVVAGAKKIEDDNENLQLENMLLTVASMEKGALEEYAKKYEVTLDKRLAVGKLRDQVTGLIEQFGVR